MFTNLQLAASKGQFHTNAQQAGTPSDANPSVNQPHLSSISSKKWCQEATRAAMYVAL
jgi:hypothetical protein